MAADPVEADVVFACADLVVRSGAGEFQIGYLYDNVPVDQASWWAHAQYRGARLTVSDQPSPAAAVEGLARRILEGARCRCGRLVALSPLGALAWDGHLANGEAWTTEDATKAGQCLWVREGPRWDPSCPAPRGRDR